MVDKAWSTITSGDEATGEQLLAACKSNDATMLENFLCTKGNNPAGKVNKQEFD
jgi:hypothetical protein